MGRFNFKGDIESVAQPQLDFIDKVLEKKGFKGPDVLIEAVGTAGDNYVANVKRVVVEENGATFKMIAKLAPESKMMREIGNLQQLFQNEHIVYTEVLPKFREIQKNAEVPDKELFRFAECYGSYTEAPHEVILMEDLKEDNYIMLDRFKPLSNECVKTVLKSFAIYHSLSYVLKHQEPEVYAALKLRLFDLFTGAMVDRANFKMYFQQLEDGALAMLQEDKYKKFMKGSVSEIIHHALKVKKGDTDSKYSIIQQGDGWTNNILFQCEGETSVNCALIDYQLSRESNPVYDIMYMLFNSTSHEQRQKHYHEFIDHYHSELDKSLHSYGLKAAFVYPRDQLDADLKRYAKYMLATCVMVSTFIIRKTEDASKIKESMKNSDVDNIEATTQSMQIHDPETILLFKSKIEGLVDSFLEFGLLQNI